MLIVFYFILCLLTNFGFIESESNITKDSHNWPINVHIMPGTVEPDSSEVTFTDLKKVNKD